MIDGQRMVELLGELGVTDLVWLPDSELGTWEDALAGQDRIRLVRVCREGEAWAVAAGLILGGRKPVVAIQCTGFFESGDAMRNVVFDLGLPVFAFVGYRSYLVQDKLPGDTARIYTEPVLKAWGLPYRLITAADQVAEIANHYRQCQSQGTAGVVLLAEGKM
jgi:sulfopyruvate decarboxylase TPP-binding subunit